MDITGFVRRFEEACGSDKAAVVARLLNISYQTARNYLDGRLPQADMLIHISDRTSCSIDWLLTGRGKKFLEGLAPEDTPVLPRQIESFVRRICVEVINAELSKRPVEPKTRRIRASEVFSEKLLNTAEGVGVDESSRTFAPVNALDPD